MTREKPEPPRNSLIGHVAQVTITIYIICCWDTLYSGLPKLATDILRASEATDRKLKSQWGAIVTRVPLAPRPMVRILSPSGAHQVAHENDVSSPHEVRILYGIIAGWPLRGNPPPPPPLWDLSVRGPSSLQAWFWGPPSDRVATGEGQNLRRWSP